jgi:hypothetical protein
MKSSKLCFCLAAVVVQALLLVSPSLADTYKIVILASDEARFFGGMNASGDVVLSVDTDYGNSCTMSSIADCYLIFINGVQSFSATTPPVFTTDDGTPCSPAVPSGLALIQGVCNSGREAFTAQILGPNPIQPGLYTGPDITELLPGEGLGEFLYLDSEGDIVWNDPSSEYWYEALDLTSETPEPSSLVLLGTGALAALGAMRRRPLHRSHS